MKSGKIFRDVLSIFKPNPKFDKARTDANNELTQLLVQYLQDNPSVRFGQALFHLDIVDDNFKMAEPQVMLARARAALARMNDAKN